MLLNKRITKNDISVFGLLNYYMGYNDTEISINELSEILNIHKNSVKNSIYKLSDMGYISVYAKDGKPNNYKTHEPPKNNSNFQWGTATIDMITNKEITKADIFVFCLIERKANEKNIKLSAYEISKITGYTTRAIQKALKKLEEMEYISVSREKGKTNGYTQNKVERKRIEITYSNKTAKDNKPKAKNTGSYDKDFNAEKYNIFINDFDIPTAPKEQERTTTPPTEQEIRKQKYIAEFWENVNNMQSERENQANNITEKRINDEFSQLTGFEKFEKILDDFKKSKCMTG